MTDPRASYVGVLLLTFLEDGECIYAVRYRYVHVTSARRQTHALREKKQSVTIQTVLTLPPSLTTTFGHFDVFRLGLETQLLSTPFFFKFFDPHPYEHFWAGGH